MKSMAIREAKDLNKMELHDLFSDLKAYELEKNSRKEEDDTSTITSTIALIGNLINHPQTNGQESKKDNKRESDRKEEEDLKTFRNNKKQKTLLV